MKVEELPRDAVKNKFDAVGEFCRSGKGRALAPKWKGGPYLVQDGFNVMRPDTGYIVEPLPGDCWKGPDGYTELSKLERMSQPRFNIKWQGREYPVLPFSEISDRERERLSPGRWASAKKSPESAS